MKKYLSIILLSILVSIGSVFGQDMLPSDVYYKDNIAVNNIGGDAPSFKGSDDDDNDNPNGGAEGDGGYVIAPVGDATLPLLTVGLAYVGFILYRRKKKATSN